MLVRVPVIGKNGILKDAPVGDLPNDSFTYAENVRFRDGMAELMKGEVETSDLSSVTADPKHINYNGDALDRYYLLLGDTKAWACQGAISSGVDITRASGDYTTSSGVQVAEKWVSDVFSDAIVATNFLDPPQYWSYPSSTQDLADLPNWPDDHACRSIRVFKNYFIALNIKTFSAGTFTIDDYLPDRVMWSHPAEPGSVPTSWDATDTTKDAGFVDIQGSDRLVDGGVMRDIFVIYKERTTHLMQYIGGQFIFRFTQAFSNSGIMGQNCWVELDGRHVVLTQNDFIMHDGFSMQSILDSKMKRWLFSNIDEDYKDEIFLVKNRYFDEVWICFPKSGTRCDTALVWNHKNNTATIRDLPNIAHACNGPVDDSGFNQTTWGDDEYPGIDSERTVMVANQSVLVADTSLHFDGSAINGELTRTGLTFGEPSKRKYVRGIRPRMKGTGQTVSIQVGVHDTLHGTVTWADAQTFTIDSDLKVDFNHSGRYIAFKLTSTSDEWKLESLDFDIEFEGDY